MNIENISKFFREHLLGIIFLGLVIGVAGNYIYDNYVKANEIPDVKKIMEEKKVHRQQVRENSLLGKQCEEKNFRSCYYLGLILINKESDEPDPKYAIVLFQLACDAGLLDACLKFGEIYEKGIYFDNDRFIKRDFQKALSFFQEKCNQGNIDLCAELVNIYEEVMFDENFKRIYLKFSDGTMPYIKACEAGRIEICIKLGDRYEIGDWKFYEEKQNDTARAIELFKRACDADNYAICLKVGTIRFKKGTKFANFPEAVNYFKKSCRDEFDKGCAELGWAYLLGKGTSPDLPKGIDILKNNCFNGREEILRASCMYLGYAHSLGMGVPRDKKNIDEVLLKMCSDKLIKSTSKSDSNAENNDANKGSWLTIGALLGCGMLSKEYDELLLINDEGRNRRIEKFW